MTVGTIQGYFYPTLETLFAEKILMRSDVNSLDLNFNRLSKGWIDSFVDSDIMIQYLLKSVDEPEQFKIASLVISEHDIQTALSTQSSVSLAKFNQALAALKETGSIDKILQKYQTAH